MAHSAHPRQSLWAGPYYPIPHLPVLVGAQGAPRCPPSHPGLPERAADRLALEGMDRRHLFLLCSALATMPTQAAPETAAAETLEVCVDYHCDLHEPVRLDAAAWDAITAPLRGSDGPAAERAAIRRAIALMEERVGALTGTWRDRAGNDADNGERGQLDCIAESLNTTTYLGLFEDAGLLRWHRVEARRKRQRWLFAVHWTAVISEIDSGVRYAVDSWYGANGALPLLQPLPQWERGTPGEDAG